MINKYMHREPILCYAKTKIHNNTVVSMSTYIVVGVVVAVVIAIVIRPKKKDHNNYLLHTLYVWRTNELDSERWQPANTIEHMVAHKLASFMPTAKKHTSKFTSIEKHLKFECAAQTNTQTAIVFSCSISSTCVSVYCIGSGTPSLRADTE